MTLRVGDLRRIDGRVGRIRSIDERVLAAARDRTVLNVGAAGGVTGYLPEHPDLWLHHRLGTVAGEVVGLDIDPEGVAHAERHGYRLTEGDCQEVDLGRRFDVIVMSDVIEHVEDPSRAVVNMTRHLEPHGRLYVTTPNATFIGNIIDAFRRGPVDVYWDHVSIFLPEHIQTICDRHGLSLHRVEFFTFVDHRTPTTRVKSRLVQVFGWISPRLHGHFLAEIGAR